MGDLITELAPLGIRRVLDDGELLCRQGEPGREAYLVLDGLIDASIGDGDLVITVGKHSVGSLVGEVTAVVGGTRIATLRSVGRTTLSVIDQAVLSAWLDSHPVDAASVLATARERTDRTRVAAQLTAQLGDGSEGLAGAIAQRMSWRSVPAGEVLYRKGELATAAYFLVSGRAQLDFGDGQTRLMGSGELIGAIEAIEEQQRPATATAVRHLTVGQLDVSDFLDLVTTEPLAAVRLVRRVISAPDSARASRSRSLAVIAVADVTVEQVGQPMSEAIGSLCESVFLTPDRVDRLLGSPGIAQVPSGASAEIRLAELLHQVEVDNDIVLLAASSEPSEWLDRVLRHADHVVLISAAHPIGDEARAIDRILAQLRQQGRPIPVWLGLRHPPRAPRARKTAAIASRFGLEEVHHLRSEEGTVAGDGTSTREGAADLARLARLAVGRGTAVVLSGGGARGFAHIGVFQSLTECGIAVDRVVGASMGSVIAAAVAQGLEGTDLLDVVERQFEGLLDYTVPMVSLLKGEKISDNIRAQWGAYDIEDLWLPFSCVSTNLTQSRSEIHRSGPVHQAVRASVALPGILPPVPFGPDLLIDGGVLDNLPISLVENDPSIETIIAVDVSPTRGPGAPSAFGPAVSGWSAVADRVRGKRTLPTLASVLMRSVSVGSARVRDQYLAEGLADLYLDLNLGGIGLLDFTDVRPIAQRGYEAAHPQLQAWASAQAGQLGTPSSSGTPKVLRNPETNR